MRAPYQRLYVNIDHVATLRQARQGVEPDPVEAALLCERAGADGITAHLREDRRHIQDEDISKLRKAVTTYLNLEFATTEEMINIALNCSPEQITLVPERREEVTTEGGLNIPDNAKAIESALNKFRKAGIRTSLFIGADTESVEWSAKLGADAVELHTGTYAKDPVRIDPLQALVESSALASSLGMAVHAGHGLTARNVVAVSRIPEIEELNIGHSIISRSIFIGIEAAVKEIRAAMDEARRVS